MFVALATLISVCQGGGFSSCKVANCAKCQDSSSKCAYCANLYFSGIFNKYGEYVNSNAGCLVQQSNRNCPAAAGAPTACLSCSPASPGTGGVPKCQKNWNPAYGCSLCPQGWYAANSGAPLPAGVTSVCGLNTVITCRPGGSSVGRRLLGPVEK